ncbi:ubiquitin thioesterase otubain-like isoform X2 [Cynara cardunculus var. scolymus]|uniref:ubiquitin thioesterase otubain-like isoform X2 n=1 Tax=Cynara cardunculus var. scolymus TaxID=59895 RepID=UPI000D62D254|nr:ubiquitin thioesterase otubain-like isoform X2 [Cynara cardunculus var. scolymus]
MQNQDEIPLEEEIESTTFDTAYEADDWSNYKDCDVLKQQSAIWEEDAAKFPFVGDKEPLSSLEAEYKSGSPILLEKIKVLHEQYAAIRRTRGDGNCFFRSFMFSYLEHIVESQDEAEVERIKTNVEKCRRTLQSLGYADFTFEDFFSLFVEQLESVLQGNEDSISHDELIMRSRDQSVSDYVVMFFRFVTSGEIRKRSEFFEPFILGLTNTTVEQAWVIPLKLQLVAVALKRTRSSSCYIDLVTMTYCTESENVKCWVWKCDVSRLDSGNGAVFGLEFSNLYLDL